MIDHSPRPPVLVGAVLGAAIFVTLSLLALGDPIDDAGITYRYAHNLATGEGLRFNPGGERVEGYVHFLWIVVLAGIERWTGIEPIEAGPWLGRLFGALTVIWTALVAARLGRGRGGWWLAAAPLLVGSNLYLVLWSGAGLETPLFTWLGLVTVHLALVGGRAAAFGAPLVLVLACMTRPEGVVIGVVLVLDRLLRGPRPDRRALTPLVVFLVPAAAYFLWRWTYFGHLLPNVFYAKAHSTPFKLTLGALYVKAFLQRDEARILLPRSFGTLVAGGDGGAAHGGGAAADGAPSALVGAAAAPVDGRGDLRGRRLDGGVPLLRAGAPGGGPARGRNRAAARRRHERRRRRARILAIALVAAPLTFNLVNGALYVARPIDAPERTWFHQRAYYDDTAAWVREHVPDGSLVALGDVGHIPYATPRVRYVDFLGLVDPVIAHLEGGVTNPEVYAYLFRRRPDWFISIRHHLPDGRARGHTPVDEAMMRFDDPALPTAERLFRPVAVLPGWVEHGETVRFHIYERAR